jgi:hypothetical protein
MWHLETRTPAPSVPGASSKTPGSGRVEDARCSAAFLRLSNVARDGNKAEVALKRLQDKWPPEFRDGVRCGFLQKREGVRDPGGYPPGFDQWQLERRNAWFAGFNVGFHDRLRLSQSEAAL